MHVEIAVYSCCQKNEMQGRTRGHGWQQRLNANGTKNRSFMTRDLRTRKDGIGFRFRIGARDSLVMG